MVRVNVGMKKFHIDLKPNGTYHSANLPRDPSNMDALFDPSVNNASIIGESSSSVCQSVMPTFLGDDSLGAGSQIDGSQYNSENPQKASRTMSDVSGSVEDTTVDTQATAEDSAWMTFGSASDLNDQNSAEVLQSICAGSSQSMTEMLSSNGQVNELQQSNGHMLMKLLLSGPSKQPRASQILRRTLLSGDVETGEPATDAHQNGRHISQHSINSTRFRPLYFRY